jgi:hypothetical protein
MKWTDAIWDKADESSHVSAFCKSDPAAQQILCSREVSVAASLIKENFRLSNKILVDYSGFLW